MKLRLVWLMLLALLVAPAAARAEEPYLDFLRGLRERGYYDYALLYLDQLARRGGLPDDVRQIIPYETAVTLMRSAQTLRSPEKQTEQLDQARGYLEQFVKESPNHPLAGEANSEQARILLNKARVEILQSKMPANEGNKGEFRKRARGYIAQAKKVFQTARDQHEAKWKSFGTFIDQQKEPEKFRQRSLAEVNLIQAMLDLAQSTYEEAQTYDQDAKERKKLLTDAVEQFDQIHQRYRTYLGGLYARLWEGKSFEEMGEYTKAMGVYEELLTHGGDHPGDDLQKLQDKTRQFKLVLLNRRGDHVLVTQEAEEWLTKNKQKTREPVGLGIRWELAQAQEALGDRRDTPEAEKQRDFRAALTNARLLSQSLGEYQAVALAMAQRLEVKLGGRGREPDTFASAFVFGQELVDDIKKVQTDLDTARQQKKPKAEIAKLQQDLDTRQQEALHMLELAVKLAGKNDDARSVNQARFLLAYVNLLTGRFYEAAILGEYVARIVDPDNETMGLEAAYLALAGYVRAYNAAPKDQKDADLGFMIAAANLLTSRWPQSDRANDARMILGTSYSQMKRPAEAAKWFGEILDSDPQYPKAQVEAGQAYWAAYLNAVVSNEADAPNPEQLKEWQAAAEKHLRNGIAKLLRTIPKEGTAPPELIAAKFSLAQILVNSGQDKAALELLTQEPHSVMKAVTVADESKRPAKGVQGRQFASEAYKLLLRTYIGVGNLDEARKTMATLEKVAAGDAGADVTELYRQLGEQLKQELDRLKEGGERDRYQQVMQAFESFLGNLHQRKEGQTFNTLSWIGETYFGLGEATKEERAKADAYFNKAGEAFQEILARSEQSGDFAKPEQLLAVKLRLVTCERRKQNFEQAEQLAVEVLKERSNDLRGQHEAAMVLQDWGTSNPTDAAKHLLQAIAGKDAGGLPHLIWGWGELGSRLQNALHSGRGEFQDEFLEARYNVAFCRRQLAEQQADPEKMKQELKKAEMEILATVSITKSFPDEEWARYDKLYQQILQDQGLPVTKLERPQAIAATAAAQKTEKANTPVAAKPTAPKAAAAAPAETSSNTLTYVLLGLTAVGFVVAMILIVTKSGRGRKRRPTSLTMAATAPPLAFGTETEAAPAPAARPKPRPAAAANPSAAAPGGIKPAAAAKPTTRKPKPQG